MSTLEHCANEFCKARSAVKLAEAALRNYYQSCECTQLDDKGIPCYKQWDTDEYGNGRYWLPMDCRCAACRGSYPLYEAVKAARQKQGICLSQMMRAWSRAQSVIVEAWGR